MTNLAEDDVVLGVAIRHVVVSQRGGGDPAAPVRGGGALPRRARRWPRLPRAVRLAAGAASHGRASLSLALPQAHCRASHASASSLRHTALSVNSETLILYQLNNMLITSTFLLLKQYNDYQHFSAKRFFNRLMVTQFLGIDMVNRVINHAAVNLKVQLQKGQEK